MQATTTNRNTKMGVDTGADRGNVVCMGAQQVNNIGARGIYSKGITLDQLTNTIHVTRGSLITIDPHQAATTIERIWYCGLVEAGRLMAIHDTVQHTFGYPLPVLF